MGVYENQQKVVVGSHCCHTGFIGDIDYLCGNLRIGPVYLPALLGYLDEISQTIVERLESICPRVGQDSNQNISHGVLRFCSGARCPVIPVVWKISFGVSNTSCKYLLDPQKKYCPG